MKDCIRFSALIAVAAALTLSAVSCCHTVSGYTVPEPCDVVMYQVNPRVFSPDNSFLAVASHVDSIKALGANVVWFMPVCEIGRDGKSKNSPYCVKDYTDVNPEYGSMDDFKAVIAKCHEKGMCVIMDWVANHSSWDNRWVAEHPEWYTQDEEGNIIHPAGTNWEDVADFNFDNPEMRLAMIDAMKFWVNEVGIDGFRCDAADFVPFDFWKQCLDSLRAIPDHKLLMLAEGGRKDHFDAGFEMNYAWSYMSVLRAVYGHRGPSTGVPGNGRWGRVTASALFEADAEEYDGIPEGCVKLRFTTNHDESDKMSPIREFHGERGSMAAFVATVFIHGGPLIYGSQEVAYPGRINFFHYVPVDWTSNSGINSEYASLMALYHEHPALRKGKVVPYPDDSVLAFGRVCPEESILILDNLRQEYVDFSIPEEWAGRRCRDLMTGKTVVLSGNMGIDPYQYLIYKAE